MEETLLQKGVDENGVVVKRKDRIWAIVLEQILKGLIHVVQFSASYCIMLLFMYSNGTYSIIEPGFGHELRAYWIYHHFYSTRSSSRGFSLYERYTSFSRKQVGFWYPSWTLPEDDWSK
jgi:hypothetical protein